jgi:predicted metalloprotease with PDZ domain
MPAQFTWRNAPGIGFASDTEHVRDLHGKLRTLQDISENVAIGGSDLHVSTGRVGVDAVRIAHVGRFDFDMRAFEGLARKIIASERGFWRDRRAGPVLITAIPLNVRPHQKGFSGTGLGDAFETWIARDTSLDDLTWFLAHEYFHSWNPGQLGHTDDATEALGYWFSEGFTDFYARRLMLRAGLLTPQHFVSEWNAALHNYAVSPYRSSGNADAARQFWNDPRARMLPYQLGAMLAAIWDQRLRHISHGKVSLDAVMRGQREQTAGSEVAPSPVAAFVQAAAQDNLDVRDDIARYLDRGSLIVLPPDAFGACAHVVTQTSPVFERGWDTEATMRNGDIVTGLDPGTRAYAAGLRNGMKLLVQSGGAEGDPDAVIRLEVQDNQIRRSIAFEPMGHTFVDVQNIELDAARFASNPAGCRIALSG